MVMSVCLDEIATLKSSRAKAKAVGPPIPCDAPVTSAARLHVRFLLHFRRSINQLNSSTGYSSAPIRMRGS